LLPERGVTGKGGGAATAVASHWAKAWLPGVMTIGLVAGLTPTRDANALWGDRLELFVAEARIYDDNVFRLSAQTDPSSLLGTSARDDVYDTISLGLRFDVPVSRQRFVGGIWWDDHRYGRFTVLDFTDRHERALWQWQAGNQLSGEIGYTEDLALASLANVESVPRPNPLDKQRVFLNAAYLFTPRWRLQGEMSRLDQSNEVPVQQVNDVRLESVDLTGSYISPAGNQIGLRLQTAKGDLPNPLTIVGGSVDNSYRQHGVELITDWTITGKSRVKAGVGWVDRSYDQLPQRDFDGGTFHARYDWQATGKLALTAAARREISAVEEININFALVTGVELRPTLRLTEKITLSAGLEYSDREYLGDPFVVLGAASRNDQVRLAELTGSYRPLRPVTLELLLRRETRSSNAPFGDYVLNLLGVRVRLGF
jgi:exopolysaccharide biosynthesis operon protein EpsL